MTFQYPINRLILSHSTISTSDNCMRKLEALKFFGEQRGTDEEDDVDNFAANVGKSLHAGCQEYLITKNEEKSILAFMLAYPHETEYGKYEHAVRGFEASYITLMEMMRSEIFDRYELVYVKGQDGVTKPAIEVPFSIEFINAPLKIPVFFVGFIDAILYDKIEQIYIVVDIKSTRKNILDMTYLYQYDEQTVPYGIILEHVLGEKIEEFKVAYLSAFIDLQEPKVKLYKFTKTKENINDWYKGICGRIARIGGHYRTQWFPRATNGSHCFAWNKPCWFAEHCSIRDPQIVNRLIGGTVREGLFHDPKIKPWVEAKLEWKEFV